MLKDSKINNHCNIKECGSGYLLLSLCVMNKKEKESLYSWGKDECDILRFSKKNIITKTNNHNMSLGEYYSFGNKGSYDNGNVNNSSVGQYANKKYKNKYRQQSSDINDVVMHQCTSMELGKGIATMFLILPQLTEHLSPIVNTASKIQDKIGDINLVKCPGYNNGCWQSQVCINACTRVFHTEKDCTYTIINVPNQDNIEKKEKQTKYNFLFMIKPKCYIGLNLQVGTTLLFSGYLLTHRQHCSTSPNEMDVSSIWHRMEPKNYLII